MEVTDVLQSLFRWVHLIFGILWIGLLYFFNFVNSGFAATLDAESKKKVVPELMPRALFWFRWGAAWTWATGLLLLLLVFYHGGVLFEDSAASWSPAAFVMLAIIFGSPFLYDLLFKKFGQNMKVMAIAGFILIAGTVCLMDHWAGFGYRGYLIHTGTLLGTIMAFNVWFRIWPAQKKIITAVKNGEAPDAALVSMAGLRSKQNTYLSIPLLWTMINSHNTWASGSKAFLFAMILLGWYVTNQLYHRAGKVKGF